MVEGKKAYLTQIDVEPVTEVSYTVTGLMPETAYYFEVLVRNADEEYATSERAQATTTANTAPTSADFTKNAHVDTNLSFSESDFPFNDVDHGDSLGGVIFFSLPDSSHGTLEQHKNGQRFAPIDSNRKLRANLGEVNELVFVPKSGFAGTASFTFEVEDLSGDNSSRHTATINVQSNGAKFTGTPPFTFSVAENATSGTSIGAPIAASDPDGDTITYWLSGEDTASFDIGTTTGQITVGQDTTLDYESKNTYSVTVNIHDGKGPDGGASTIADDSARVTITVTNEREQARPVTGLTATVLSSISIRLDWTAPDNTGLSRITGYQIHQVGSGRPFTDDPLPIRVRSTNTAYTFTDLSPNTSYDFHVIVRNMEGRYSSEETVSATTPGNSAPTSADFRVYLPAAGDLSFSASDFPFTDVEGSLGKVKIVSLPSSSDGVLKWTPSGGSEKAVPAGQLIPSAELSTLKFEMATSTYSGPEDLDFGPAPFTFKVVDQHGVESGGTYTATIWNRHYAQISSVKITSTPAVGDTYGLGETIQVKVTFDKYVTWDVSQGRIVVYLDNYTDYRWAWLVTGGLATSTVTEMVFEYTVDSDDRNSVGLGFDLDSGGNLVIANTYGGTLVAEHSNGVRRGFRSGAQKPPPDPNHKINGSLKVNLPPAFTQAAPVLISVAEDAAAGSSVGSPVTANDPNPGDSLTYSLSGTDAASFAIASTTGQISVGESVFLDYEASKNSYALVVNVSDGKDAHSRPATTTADIDDSVDVRVSVTDVTEPSLPPAEVKATALSSSSIRVNWSAPDNRGRTAVTGYELLYATATTSLDATATTTTLTGLAKNTSYNIQVRAQNEDGFSDWVTVGTTTLANMPPTSADFMKNTPPDTDLLFFASDFAFEDPDVGDTRSRVWITTLPNQTHGVLKWREFGVNLKPVPAVGGFIYESELDTLVFSPATSFTGVASFTFRVMDQEQALSKATYTATINVQADSPNFTETVPLVRSIAENSAAGDNVGVAIAASDPNEGDTIYYSLSGVDAASFVIASTTGQITVGQDTALDYEAATTTYTMIVSIHDGKGPDGATSTMTDASAALTISVADVDEPPPAPTGLILASNSPGTLSVEWTAPDTSGRPPLTGYGVEYKLTATTTWTNHLDPANGSTSTSTTIEGLTQDEDYDIRVWAVNDEGAGGYLSGSQNVSPTPRLLSVTIVSNPGEDGFYGPSEEVRIRATFNTGVQITRETQETEWLTMRVDLFNGRFDTLQTARLDLLTVNGNAYLDFTFYPGDGDDGSVGIRFERDPISVPEGAAITALGQDVMLDFARTSADTSHKVDGVRPSVVGTPVFSSTPHNGTTYQLGEKVSLDVTFSEAVHATGTPYYNLRLGTTANLRKFYYDSKVSTTTLRFSYTVAARDRGAFNRAAGRFTGSDKVVDARGNVAVDLLSATAQPSHPVDGSLIINRDPSITLSGPLVFRVNENTAAGTIFGVPITASDPNLDDTITYSLSGDGVSYFAVSSSGQLSVAQGVSLDYEALTNNSVGLTVSISDGLDSQGKVATSTDDSITVTVVIADVVEKPLAPVFVAAAVSSVSVQVDWTVDNAGRPPITKYQLKYNDGTPEDKLVTITDLDSRTTTITGLYPRETVKITLRAVNRDGEGPWAATSSVTTLANSPPTSRDVTREVLAGGRVTFSASDFHFEDPDTAHDPLEKLSGVQIVTLPPADKGTLKIAVPNHPERAVTAKETLPPNFLEYLVFDASESFTGSATSTFKVTDIRTQTSESAYTITIRQVSNRQPVLVDTEFRAVYTVYENSPPGTQLTLFQLGTTASDPDEDILTYSLSGEDAASFYLGSSTSTALYVAEGATLDYESKQTYNVTIDVSDGKNGVGDPDPAVDVSYDPHVGIYNVLEPPPPPANVTVTGLASRALRVSWGVADLAGAPPIIDYSLTWVEVREGVPDTDVKEKTLGATSTSYTITGLKPNTQYQVTVWARNSDGRGTKVVPDPAPFTPPNSLPTSQDFTKYAPFTFQASDFSFYDEDANEYSNDALSGVRIMTLPKKSKSIDLRLSGSKVSPNQLIPVDQLSNLAHRDEGVLSVNDSFTFRVTDSYGGESTASYTVHLRLPKNLPPEFQGAAPASRRIDENSPAGTAVGAPVTATDRSQGTDIGTVPTQDLTYSLSGDDAASFVLATSTGQLTLAEGVTVDHEAKDLYTVTVEVHDGLDAEGNEDTSTDASIDVNIHVGDLAEPPDEPHNYTPRPLSSTSIRLDWDAPDNTGRPPIESYVILTDAPAERRGLLRLVH